jgi:hypothetical protein
MFDISNIDRTREGLRIRNGGAGVNGVRLAALGQAGVPVTTRLREP